jgi:hypothetical protein
MTRSSERQQFAEQNGMTMEFVNWFFDTKKEGCGNAWFIMAAAAWEGWKGKAELLAVREAQSVPAPTVEHQRVILMLLGVCGAAFELADDCCQQEVDGELCHVVPGDSFKKLSDALDEIENTLPDEYEDLPNTVLQWAAVPRHALRAMLQPVSQGYTFDGLNIRAVAALRSACSDQWLNSKAFADKVHWQNMHSIANEIMEAMAAAPTPTKAVSEYSIAKYEELFGEACQAAPYPVKHENESVPSLLKRNAEKQEQISELLASITPIKLPEIMEIAEDATRETRHLIRSRNYLIESIAGLLRYQGLKVEGFPDEIPGKEKS